MIILSYDCIFRFLLSRPSGNMSGCERAYARLHAMIFQLQPDSDVDGGKSEMRLRSRVYV